MAYINYRPFQSIDIAELVKTESFIRETLSVIIDTKTNKKGLLIPRDSIGSECQVAMGSNLDTNGNKTLKINGGYFVAKGFQVADNNNNAINNLRNVLVKFDDEDNIEITDIASKANGDVVYVIATPVEKSTEIGSITITASSNQITATGIDFTKLLRDQSSGVPSKIRFKKSASSPTNNLDYEVVQILSSTTAIISGSLVDEQNLELEVIGSFDLNEQMDLSNKYLYSYIKGSISFSISDTVTDEQVILAKLTFDGTGSFVIDDLRYDNVLKFLTENATKLKIEEKTSDFTIQHSDEDKLFKVNSTNAVTITIPLNGNFQIGCSINFVKYNTGIVSIQGEAGVLLRVAEQSSLRKQYSVASVIKIDTNEWLLTGDITLS
jgi:hypothetical protein